MSLQLFVESIEVGEVFPEYLLSVGSEQNEEFQYKIPNVNPILLNMNSQLIILKIYTIEKLLGYISLSTSNLANIINGKCWIELKEDPKLLSTASIQEINVPYPRALIKLVKLINEENPRDELIPSNNEFPLEEKGNSTFEKNVNFQNLDSKQSDSKIISIEYSHQFYQDFEKEILELEKSKKELRAKIELDQDEYTKTCLKIYEEREATHQKLKTLEISLSDIIFKNERLQEHIIHMKDYLEKAKKLNELENENHMKELNEFFLYLKDHVDVKEEAWKEINSKYEVLLQLIEELKNNSIKYNKLFQEDEKLFIEMVKEINSTLNKKDKEIIDIEGKNETVKKEINGQNENLTNILKENDVLQKEITRIEVEIKNAENEKLELENKSEENENEQSRILMELNIEILKLKAKLDELNAINSLLKIKLSNIGNIESINQQYGKIESSNNTMNKNIESCSNNVSKNQEILLKLYNEMRENDLNFKNEDKEKQLNRRENTKKAIDLSKIQIQNLKEELARINKNIDAEKIDEAVFEELKRNAENMRLKIEEYKTSKVKPLLAEFEEQTKLVEKLSFEIDSVNKIQENKEKELGDLKLVLKEKNDISNDLQLKIDKINEINSNLSEENQQKELQLKSYIEKRDEVASSIQLISMKSAEADKKIEKLNKYLEDKNIKLDMLTETLAKEEQEKKDSQEKLEEVKKSEQDLTDTLDKFQKDKETLERDSELKTAALEKLKENQLKEEENEENYQLDQLYAPKRSDKIDQMFAFYMNRNNNPVNLRRLAEGQYMFGSKKIMAKVQNDKLIIRVGGGYMLIDEFLSAYTAQELAKLQMEEKMEEFALKEAQKHLFMNPESQPNQENLQSKHRDFANERKKPTTSGIQGSRFKGSGRSPHSNFPKKYGNN